MSIAVKEILRAGRPPGAPGRMDKYLADIAQALWRLLEKSQRGFSDRSVMLPGERLNELAAVLVEFGEDLHADAGLWRSLENYNRQFFGRPLPLAADDNAADVPAGFDQRRIQHLTWTWWTRLDPEVCHSHPNLLELARVTGAFLTERFARLPVDSGVKNFLAGPSRFGWEIKRKLVWLGTKSYLLRCYFTDYAHKQDAGATIAVTDDFICEESTGWSGLGAIDVLAGALDLPAEDRATLRTWYERHAAFYRVESRQDQGTETESIVVRNLVNGQQYTVRMNMQRCPFQPGLVVFGSLTPWRGEWYWSGEQQLIKDSPAGGDARLRQHMLERNPRVAYRYCTAEAAQAKALNRKQYDEFVAHCGGDLVVYPDGLALAAAEQKRLEALWRAADPGHVKRLMSEHDLKKSRPPMQFPREFLEHNQGIGVFYNPEEGQELMLGFNDVLSGLRKQGDALSDPEREGLRHLMTDHCASPAFVNRLTAEHGATSLLETFHMRDLPPDRALEFLLRRHKGQFYRNRYPLLSLIQGGES